MKPDHHKTSARSGLVSKQRLVERKKAALAQEIFSVTGLTLVWCALWQEFNVGSFFFGVIAALLVTKFFYLPPFEVSNRFNIGWLVILGGVFFWDLVAQSFRVFWVAVTKGKRTRSAIVRVPLHTSSDLITTLTALTISLIPGSTVLEIDRSTRSIYLHILNVEDRRGIEKSRRSIQKFEELIILVFGNTRQVTALRRLKKQQRGTTPTGVHKKGEE